MRPGDGRFASGRAGPKAEMGGKDPLDIRPPGPKGLGPIDIAQVLGWGFTRVLPQAPENRPQAWALGWPGPGWAGLAYNARARNESKGN